MRASDLRIGNIIGDGHGNPLRVTAVNDVLVVSNDYGFEYHELHPFPLTHEILEKCGFISEPIDEGYPEVGVYYSLPLNNELYCNLCIISGDKNDLFEVCLFPYEQWFRFKYLHQLQNLFYALCGEEIIVNL